VSVSFAGDPKRTHTGTFSAAELEFALAWAVFAPGLGGWTVQADISEDGAKSLLVDPPLVYGDGFQLWLDGPETVISWSAEERRVATLREAMLLICPLSPEALAAVEALTAASESTF
jgi:hypothetical protein